MNRRAVARRQSVNVDPEACDVFVRITAAFQPRRSIKLLDLRR